MNTFGNRHNKIPPTMNDRRKTKETLINELIRMRRQIAEMEASEARLKKKRKVLLKSDDTYRLFAENASDVIWTVDMNHAFTSVSPSVTRVLGYTVEDMASLTIEAILVPDSLALVVNFLEENVAASTGVTKNNLPCTSKTVDMKVIREDGSTLWTETTITYMKDTNDAPLGIMGVTRDIDKRKRAEEALKKSEEDLKIKSHYLQEANTALKVLLKHREEDKIEFQGNVLSNVKELIMPYIEKLKTCRSAADQTTCLNILETNLNNIISPFLRNITIRHFNLTPRELQVASLIKDGKSTKEIAELLNLSTRAIEFHRENIRKKLGLKNKKVNLQSYLLSLI